MSKYVYPAIFTSEPDGGYSVYFPDLEGCYTCGDTLADALFMAEDALALILYGYEKDQRPIPQPSKMSGIKVTADSFLSMVACDTLEYRKRFNNKAVKKQEEHFCSSCQTVDKTLLVSTPEAFFLFWVQKVCT